VTFGYGWVVNVLVNGFSVTVPNEGSAPSGTQVIGSSNQATVIYPAFGSTGLVGTAAFVEAELYLDYGGQFEPITVPPGIVQPVWSNISILAAGVTTCADYGYAVPSPLGPVRGHK
jgi:hypothetical protein